MPVIWLAVVLSWAIVRAVEETWSYGKVATRPARTKLDKAVRSRTKRGDWVPLGAKHRKTKGLGSWSGWAALSLLWLTGKTLHHGWGAAKSVGRGVRTGVAEGRRRFADGQEARQDAKWDWDAWFDYLNAKSYEPEKATVERLDTNKPDEPDDIVEADVVEDRKADYLEPPMIGQTNCPRCGTPITAIIPADEPNTWATCECGQRIEFFRAPPDDPPPDDSPALEADDTTPADQPEPVPALTGPAREEITMTVAHTGEAPNLAEARSAAAAIESTLLDTMSTVEHLIASLASAGVGQTTTSRFYAVMDSISTAVTQARSAADGMEDDHGAVEEIVAAKSDVVATSTDFYRGG